MSYAVVLRSFSSSFFYIYSTWVGLHKYLKKLQIMNLIVWQLVHLQESDLLSHPNTGHDTENNKNKKDFGNKNCLRYKTKRKLHQK